MKREAAARGETIFETVVPTGIKGELHEETVAPESETLLENSPSQAPSESTEDSEAEKIPEPTTETKKCESWENYFQNFVSTCQEAWNKGKETVEDIAFPFPIFPLAENEDLAEMDEPLDLFIRRTDQREAEEDQAPPALVSEDVAGTSSQENEAAASSSWTDWAEKFTDFWAMQEVRKLL